MSEHQASPILPCNDIDATQAFYERLGFALVAGDQGFRIMADGKGWQLALRPAEHGWVIPDRNSHGIYLYCEDVDAVADRVRLSSKRTLRTVSRGAYTSSQLAIRMASSCGSVALGGRAMPGLGKSEFHWKMRFVQYGSKAGVDATTAGSCRRHNRTTGHGLSR